MSGALTHEGKGEACVRDGTVAAVADVQSEDQQLSLFLGRRRSPGRDRLLDLQPLLPTDFRLGVRPGRLAPTAKQNRRKANPNRPAGTAKIATPKGAAGLRPAASWPNSASATR